MAPSAPFSTSSTRLFGPFLLNAATGELRKSGIPIKLRFQAIEVLLMLTERAGEMVTREEIRQRLWKQDTFVDFERSINFCVNQIRAALEDDAENPRYVETLPRRGYRFIAPVTGDACEARFAKSTEGGAAVLPVPPEVRAPASARRRTLGLLVAVPLLVATWSIYRWTTHRHDLALPHMQIRKLTDNGQVSSVAITPDGRYVVYAFRVGEKEGLRLHQVASGKDVEILPPDANGFHGLTISPDGDYVYFVRSDKNDPFFKYLYSMPVLGGTAQKLVTDVDSPISFSPDGRRFVYEHCLPKRNEIELKIADTGQARESLLATFTGVSCSLYQPGPNWSPNGKTIVVPVYKSGTTQRWGIYAVNVSNSKVRLFYSSPYDIGRPVWLAGGNALLIPHSDSQSGAEQLWTLSFPKGETHRLTNDLIEYAADLDITRDEGTVAGVARSTVSNVWLAPAADPSRAQQITSGSLPMIDAGFSSDGTVLSVSSDSKLWVSNSDGKERTLLADQAGWLTPCGRFVVFASYKDGGVALTRINPDGSNVAQIVTSGVWKPLRTSLSTRAPACSPDGKFIYYLNSDQPQRICRASVESGSFVAVAETLGDGIAGRLSLSTDGAYIAYIYDQYSGTTTPGWKLVVIPSGGGPPVKTFDVPGGAIGPRWSSDGASLQYLVTKNGTTNIWEQPVTGAPPRQLTRFTSGKIFEFARSEDGKRLIFCRGEVSSDVFLMSNFH